jgi:hypothetical protein
MLYQAGFFVSAVPFFFPWWIVDPHHLLWCVPLREIAKNFHSRPAPDPRRACVPLAIEKKSGLRPHFFRISPRGRVLVHPRAGAVPGTKALPRRGR